MHRPFQLLLLIPGLLPSLLLGQVESAPQKSKQQLTIFQTRYQLRVGEPVKIEAPPETLDFLLRAKTRRVEIAGKEEHGFVVAPNRKGDRILLAASLRMRPGTYAVKVSAVTEAGEERVTTLTVVLNPPQPVPSTATQPPVVLLNGWQLGLTNSCPPSSIADTFGSTMVQQLQTVDHVPEVYWFDNCVEDANQGIEVLGNDLGEVLKLIQYDTGGLVPQIDLISHSMGGLIARAYLSGLQPGGLLVPPADPRVRKLILIATPNFGSFYAANYSAIAGLGTQSAEMIPGSAFLWNLATWNQRGDDLRGVDALAIIGNAGTWSSSALSSTVPNASDGVVSVTSGSLSFAGFDSSRTRILPYCHTDSPPLACSVPGATPAQPSIARIDQAPETGQIILDFLANDPAWMSIGSTPSTDPYLANYGGVYLTVETADGQYLSDLNPSSVFFGTTELNSGGASDRVFYNEFVQSSTGTFRAASASVNQITYGPVTAPSGHYSMFRAKFSPVISGVIPLSANAGWVVQSGATITIRGIGFGQQQCSSCQVLAVPPGSTFGYVLSVSSWTDQAISASFLPATMPNLALPGLVTIYVELSSSVWDSINIMAAAEAQSCSFTLGSYSTPLTQVGTASAGGVLPEIPSAVSIVPTTGAICTGNFTATSSAPWLDVTTVTNRFVFTALSNAHPTARSATIALSNANGGNAAFTVTEAGDPEPLNSRQVRALYQSVLGRDPDSGGFGFWTAQGSLGLGQMLDLFLTSPEAFNSDFAVMAAYQAATGTVPTYEQFTSAVASIRAGATVAGLFNSLVGPTYTLQILYQNLLNRAPLPSEITSANAGLAACFQALIGYPSNTSPVSALNNEFMSTGTFQTGPDHSNGLFVAMLYYVILGRDLDQTGYSFWLGVANGGGPGLLFQGAAGQSARLQILGLGTPNEGFAGSPEFQGLYQ